MNSSIQRGFDAWAYLRFSIIGGLLANPPQKGDLKLELEQLAQKRYRHPIKKEQWITFGFSTIERWYYKAVNHHDPVNALGRKIRADVGLNRTMSSALIVELKKQYKIYPGWSYQLHADNLNALVQEKPSLGKPPSYSTVYRQMQKNGWIKYKSGSSRKTQGKLKAEKRLEQREVRSFESPYVHGLWHLDFHSGKRIVDIQGEWYTPKALCILDDHSRLCCHIQWYLDETADTLIHGFTQALHKRGIPRSLMTDNGSAMVAEEFQNGLFKLSIAHDKTLPYSPYQNGKQEAFWGQLEGRLIAMLSKVEPLTLDFLNQATQAWVEQEYNRSIHEETGRTPLDRMLSGPDVGRPPLDGETLRFYFTAKVKRTQRRSDGTLQVKGVRFEIPSRFRHLKHLHVAYQPSNLTMAYLIDGRTGDDIGKIFPQDKLKNAQGARKALEPLSTAAEAEDSSVSDTDIIPPLLRKILSDYAATGLPPAYIPRGETSSTDGTTKYNDEHLF
jgi:transposase InsO family protein